MSGFVIDLRNPAVSHELPDLEFSLGDTDQAIARIARQKIEEQRLEANKHDKGDACHGNEQG